MSVINKEVQKTVNEIAEGLKKELGGLPATVKALNDRIETLEANLETTKTSNSQLVRALDDLTARVSRQITLSESGMVFMPDGRGSGRFRMALPEAFVKLFYRVATGRGPLDAEEMREMSSGVAADGGYLIKPEVLPIFQQALAQYGVFRRNTMVVPLSSNSATFPKLATAVNVYWPAENAPGTESFPTFGEVTLTVKKMMGLTHISLELMQDASPDLAQLVTQLFLQAIAKEEDRQGFTCNGVGANNPFVGILEDPGVPAHVMTGNNFNLLADLDLLRVQSLVDSSALANAKYYIHRSVFARLREAKDTTGRMIWQAPTDTQPSTILGYPYEIVEIMPALSETAVAKAFVIFGDLNRGTMLGDRMAVTIDRSDAPGFANATTSIRLIERITTKVVDPTQLAVIETAAA